MKTGIITQPLHTNYGGLLQNYALQKTLRDCGHEVYTINKRKLRECREPVIKTLLKDCARIIARRLLNKATSMTSGEIATIQRPCQKFVDNNITTTKKYHNDKELTEIVNRHKFEAYVVGSDQVWRPRYSANIYNDFLDFCQAENNIKRIAYAASFGVDEWEFTPRETTECSRLAQLFDAISVREESGIELCRKHLKTEAQQVIDPTMLLSKETYMELAQQAGEEKSSGELFCYILDGNDSITHTIDLLEERLSMKSFQVTPKKKSRILKRNDRIEDYIIPAPTKWIQAFNDAKIVFTDSFHGCVFSIIFNKPFWVIGNNERGNARFHSLLTKFNLKERLIDIKEIESTDLNTPIDWERVNTIKEEWKRESLNFIKKYL